MTYLEMLKKAEEAKTLKTLNPKFIQWENEGDLIIGRFIDRIEVVSTRGQGTYNQYVFDTDDGLVKFALGSATDKEAGNQMMVNHVYLVLYKGKENLPGARTLNRFLIQEVPVRALMEEPAQEATGQ